MKPNLHNPYGYKVCYKERGSKEYIRHFLTYTYSQARQAKMYYIKYPQRSREDDHLLDRPEWVIIPVKKSEVRAGIWHEVPFWKQKDFCIYDLQKKRKSDIIYTEIAFAQNDLKRRST